jgi:hypothetical protein
LFALVLFVCLFGWLLFVCLISFYETPYSLCCWAQKTRVYGRYLYIVGTIINAAKLNQQ